MRVFVVAALAATLAACAPDAPPPAPDVPAEPSIVNPALGLEAPAGPEDPAQTSPSTSPEAAAGVVLAYYGAIAEEDYAKAYAMWGPAGPPDQTFEAFARGYAETTDVNVSVEEPSDLEGAAGSVYVTVPVNVTASRQGTPQRFEGEYVLRRVNGVEGAEPWQLQWHISSATLEKVE